MISSMKSMSFVPGTVDQEANTSGKWIWGEFYQNCLNGFYSLFNFFNIFRASFLTSLTNFAMFQVQSEADLLSDRVVTVDQAGRTQVTLVDTILYDKNTVLMWKYLNYNIRLPFDTIYFKYTLKYITTWTEHLLKQNMIVDL